MGQAHPILKAHAFLGFKPRRKAHEAHALQIITDHLGEKKEKKPLRGLDPSFS